MFTSLARRYIANGGTAGARGLRLAIDVEANGLLADASRIHCVVVAGIDDDSLEAYGPDQIPAALEHLVRADYLTGHNIAGFDLPLLQKVCAWSPAPMTTVVDTLITSRLVFPHLAELDEIAAAMSKCSCGQIRGSYSLEAWGARLGMPKIGADIADWSAWTPAIQERCVGDVRLTKALWRFLCPEGCDQRALALEHRVAEICEQLEVDGMPFDAAEAERLYDLWQARRAELARQLHEQFPAVTNFNSRKQIAELLEGRGWVPDRRSEKTGQPVVDEDVLETLPELFPEFGGLAEYFMLGHRIGQLKTGPRSWLNNTGADGRIHGVILHIGQPHHRAKHLHPNLAGIPNSKKGAPFGDECRRLFRHPGDWVFVTADQANLQDRAFAHYLAKYDGGARAAAFAAGKDQHWLTALALGFGAEGLERDKENKVHTAIREGAKRFNYAFLYGAGAPRLGRIVGDIVRTLQHLGAGSDLRQRLFGGAEHPSEATLKRVGKNMLERFLRATPGLAQLRFVLKAQFRRCGWLPGLDGRRVPGGADYKCLNRIVTAAEAVVCKHWLAAVDTELRERFAYGWAGDVVIVAWVHDEIVICCRPDIAEDVGQLVVRHAKKAGAHYEFRVPLEAEFKIGRDWAGAPVNDGNGAEAKLAAPTGAKVVTPAPPRVQSPVAAQAELKEILSSVLPEDPEIAELFGEPNGGGGAQEETPAPTGDGNGQGARAAKWGDPTIELRRHMLNGGAATIRCRSTASAPCSKDGRGVTEHRSRTSTAGASSTPRRAIPGSWRPALPLSISTSCRRRRPPRLKRSPSSASEHAAGFSSAPGRHPRR
jgi:DNA polymerase I-like protein with 3'-5' exonuclease and polymerase domains